MDNTLRRTRMFRAALAACILALLTSTPAWSLLSQYSFTATTGTSNDMSGASTLMSGGNDDAITGTLTLPFTFKFDGTDYTSYAVTSNGVVYLGGQGPGAYTYGFCPNSTYANVYIAPCSRDMITTGSGIRGLLTGSPGSQVYTIEWEMYAYSNSAQTLTCQVRLYEGSGKWEMYYGSGNRGFSAYYGANVNGSNYVSVYPTTGAVYSSGCYYDAPPVSGTLYIFEGCKTTITGNVAQGGTAAMNNGDVLLSGVSVQRGSSTTRTPLTVNQAGVLCSAKPMTYIFSGPAAADYSATPASTTTYPSTPTITFTPNGTGTRNATLVVTNGVDFSRLYNLAAVGTARVSITGNPAQGGPVAMANGDALLTNVSVQRATTTMWQPFTVLNFSASGPANITYTIKGTSAGQYTIAPPSIPLNGGQSNTPTITFTPTQIGTIIDTLTVNLDGDVRVYQLAAFSQGTAGSFSINKVLLDTNATLFINQFSCVGEGQSTLQLTVANIGSNPFHINKVEAYETDTVYKQGTPRYPLRRDAFGKLIPAGDYFLTTVPPAPGVVPGTGVITIPVGQTVTLYLTFIASRPGKRFARVFFRTDDELTTNTDTNNLPTLGLIRFDAFGRGIGGTLSDNPNGGLPKTLVFANTAVGQSSDSWLYLQNPGTCNLRISEGELRIYAGDVEEFKVISVPAGWMRDAVTGDLILPPGGRDSLQLRFTPRHNGSRRASLWLRTNDSTVKIPGLTERGSYYLDLYGEGTQGLYASNADFGTVELGGAAPSMGVVRLRNSSNGPMTIQSATIGGTDAADFTEDPANPWAAQPLMVMPGQSVDFSIVFNPTGTLTGPRSGALWFVTDLGDTITAQLAGEAGSRTVAVNPVSVVFGNLSVGKEGRQTVSITNTGTMPLHLQAPVLGGANPGDYSLGALPRLDLAPGQMELLEVTFLPTVAGPSNATITIGTDAPGGAVVVQLGGTAVKTKKGIEDPSGTVALGDGGLVVPGAPGLQNGASSVGTESRIGGLVLRQSNPNPARDEVVVGYTVPRDGEVSLALYDNSGRLLRVLESGTQIAGDHTVRVNVRDLASGQYHYRLVALGYNLSRSLTVVR